MLLPIMLFWMIIALLALIFWIWMLVDCLTRKKFEDKLVWVLVLILLNVLGAILYYFLVKRKKGKRSR
jgi:prolipoprotein diacylglyceryltransferase